MAGIRGRFQRAIDEGDLQAGADASGLARFVATIMHGLAVQATGSASRKELLRVKDMVLRMWCWFSSNWTSYRRATSEAQSAVDGHRSLNAATPPRRVLSRLRRSRLRPS
jgi:hypothetical protein